MERALVRRFSFVGEVPAPRQNSVSVFAVTTVALELWRPDAPSRLRVFWSRHVRETLQFSGRIGLSLFVFVGST